MSPTRVATITMSDTRTELDDEGGRVLGERLSAAGFEVASHRILREEPEVLRDAVRSLTADARIDAIVITGGTGLSPRDRTVEAIEPLFDRRIDGFGEAFRRLSWEQVGPRAILSNATAGLVAGRVVIALPGSVAAVRLATDALLAPVLAHAVAIARGTKTAHHHGAKPTTGGDAC
jgi:molybdenum cofactor biosynthesis protein B